MRKKRAKNSPQMLQKHEIAAFQKSVWAFYRNHGRDLPWRRTTNPYYILVSELMLQQTQVDRVIPKYNAFIQAFPNIRALAEAPLSEVLTMWSGLGYNRRAKFLKQLADIIVTERDGAIPSTVLELQELPGIGPYTAAAIAAFAYNAPEALIETNIRTVFIYTFFTRRRNPVSDAELLPLIQQTCDAENLREWYWALMDYGAYLKRVHGNAGRKSSTYTKQSAFRGSARELRGAIIRELTQEPNGLTVRTLAKCTERTVAETQTQLAALISEGFVKKEKYRYFLV